MSTRISRRGLLGLGFGASVAAALSACGDGASNTGGVTKLTVTSYGDPTKLKLRGEVAAKFSSTHPKIQMTFEGFPSSNYFDKLAVQFSAGRPPDVINMDEVHLAQYASNGVLAPLDPYMPTTIRVSGFDKYLLGQGAHGGKQYGLPVGVSSYGIGYDETLLHRLGIPVPTIAWTYDDFTSMLVDVHKAGGAQIYGSEDGSGDWPSFEVFLRSRGQALYRDGKTLAFAASDVTDWLQMWASLRQNGGCVPADMAASYIYDDNSGGPVIKGHAAFEHIFTPNFTGGYQGMTKDTLRLITPPAATRGGHHGAYQAPSSVMVMSTKCSDKTAGATFVDWFCNSPQSAQTLRFISGPMASSIALAGLTPGSTSAAENEVIRYTKAAPTNALPPPPLAPAVDSQVNQLFLRTSQDIAFGKQKIPDAVPGFIKQANSLLSRG